MRKIKLGYEYKTYPIWERFYDGGVDEINPNTLPISNELKKIINFWDDRYQSTFDSDYPPNSKFQSIEEEKDFLKAVNLIYKKLTHELSGNFIVESAYSNSTEIT